MTDRQLGVQLVRDGVLTEAQLELAFELQSWTIGSLDTNLLEVGVRESLLLEGLGRYYRAPIATAADLAAAPPSLAHLISPRVARRHLVVPFRRDGKKLSVALLKTGDLLVEDEIGLLTGCMIIPHIALEVRLFEALDRLFNIQPPERLIVLSRKLAEGRIVRLQPPAPPPPPPGMSLRPTGPPVSQLSGPSEPAPPTVGDGSFFAPNASPRPAAAPTADLPSPPRPVVADLAGQEPVMEHATELPDSDLAEHPHQVPVDEPAGKESGRAELATETASPAVAPPTEREVIEPAAEVPPGEAPSDQPEPQPLPDVPPAEENLEDLFEIPSVPTIAEHLAGVQRPTPLQRLTRLAELAISEDDRALFPQLGAEGEVAEKQPVPAGAKAAAGEVAPATAVEEAGSPGTQRSQPVLLPEDETDPDLRLAMAAVALLNAEMREDIADTLLAYCTPFLRRRALLILRKDQVIGWRGEGEGVDEDVLRGVSIPTSEPSVFGSLAQGAGFWRGVLPPLPRNWTLISALGGTRLPESVVLPVVVRSKTVCFLYGDNLDAGLADLPLEQLRRLVVKAGIAFQVYILKSKIRTV